MPQETETKPSEESLKFFETMKGGVSMPAIEEEESPAIPTVKDDLDLVRPPSKRQVKATPEESLAALRKQRDAADTSLKVFKETFGDNPPQLIKPLFDYVTEISNGPITESTVTDFLAEHKSLKEDNDRLVKRLQEKEKIVNEVDIRYSDEFKNDFDLPYKEAAQTLFLEFANLDGETVLAPSATKKFNDFLLAKPDSTALEVKSQLNTFVKEFREESGEDPIVPGVSALMESLRGFRDKAVKLNQAYTNWSETKKQRQTDKLTQSQAQKEEQDKTLSKQRKELAAKAYRDFDLDSIPFVDEKEVETFVREEYQLGEDIRDGKVPPYDEFVKRGIKTRLWDKYSKQLAELIDFKEKYDKSERSGLEGESRMDKTPIKDGESWLTMRR